MNDILIENVLNPDLSKEEVRNAMDHFNTCEVVECKWCVTARYLKIKDRIPRKNFWKKYITCSENSKQSLLLFKQVKAKIATSTDKEFKELAKEFDMRQGHYLMDRKRFLGMTRYLFRKFKEQPRTTQSSEHGDCGICMEKIIQKRVFQCGHGFCRDCCEQLEYEQEDPKCGICRQKIILHIDLF